MSHEWPQGFRAEFFSPREFKHPDLMDPNWIRDLDTVRMRCGFPLKVNSGARTLEEHEYLYRKEIAKGLPYPADSSHLFDEDNPVRASDLEPSPPKEDDGCDLTLDQRELALLTQVLRMHNDGRWPWLGLICETGHFHIDDTPRLKDRRPYYGVGISR